MPQRPLKVTVVGDGTVGKTCLLLVFAENKFPQTHVPTVIDWFSSNIDIDGRTYCLTLWDTAGQESYDRLRILSYPNTDVFLVCYAVGNRNSFENIATKWIPELRSHCPKTPIVLVGTKADMRKATGNCIEESEVEAMSKKIRAAKAVECSAMTRHNIRLVFETAVIAALRLSPEKSTCSIL